MLNISSLSDTSPTQGSDKGKGVDETSTRSTPDEEPPHRGEWESRVDLSRVKDGSLRGEITETPRKHWAMWNGSLGTINATEERIDFVAVTKRIRSMPYRRSPAMRTKVAAEVTKMINAGVIEPLTSEWASPVVLVPKKDGTSRHCVDYRRLNTETLANAYPLPYMEDCIDSLGNARVFSTLDCNYGYWQVPVAKEDPIRPRSRRTSELSGTFICYLGSRTRPQLSKERSILYSLGFCGRYASCISKM